MIGGRMAHTLKTEIKDNIGLITLDRPKALNAINQPMLTELDSILQEWYSAALYGVILTGAGRAFAAGADISQMSKFSALEAQNFARDGQQVLRRLERFPGPTIAAVNGFALGGGCELAMSCDMILAGEYARFGQPEVMLGVIPGFGGTQRLVSLVGKQRALELMMTGRHVKAIEAVELGLALEVVEGDVVQHAFELAKSIAKNSPAAVRLVKQVVDQTTHLDIETGLATEASYFGLCFSSQDQKEGMSAFIEKRSPQFVGR